MTATSLSSTEQVSSVSPYNEDLPYIKNNPYLSSSNPNKNKGLHKKIALVIGVVLLLATIGLGAYSYLSYAAVGLSLKTWLLLAGSAALLFISISTLSYATCMHKKLNTEITTPPAYEPPPHGYELGNPLKDPEEYDGIDQDLPKG